MTTSRAGPEGYKASISSKWWSSWLTWWCREVWWQEVCWHFPIKQA